jgi:hypothetical protein
MLSCSSFSSADITGSWSGFEYGTEIKDLLCISGQNVVFQRIKNGIVDQELITTKSSIVAVDDVFIIPFEFGGEVVNKLVLTSGAFSDTKRMIGSLDLYSSNILFNVMFIYFEQNKTDECVYQKKG